MKAIGVALNNGTRIMVRCLWRGKAWAATAGVPSDGDYTATHIRTGINSKRFKRLSKAAAIRLAKALDAAVGEPWPRSQFACTPKRITAATKEKIITLGASCR